MCKGGETNCRAVEELDKAMKNVTMGKEWWPTVLDIDTCYDIIFHI